MPLVEEFKPGAKIFNFADRYENGFPTGTFTCFARSPARAGVLFGITAKHVLPQPGDTCVITDGHNTLLVGMNRVPAGTLDCVYFEIPEGVRTQLTQENFIPRGKTVEPTQVWDPGKLQQKVAATQDDDLQTALKFKMMRVELFGAKQNVLGVGDLNKFADPGGTTYINNTQIAKGDSGGYVLDPSKLRYAGLISAGHSLTNATQGKVVLLHAVFQAAGLILATWQDRAHWV